MQDVASEAVELVKTLERLAQGDVWAREEIKAAGRALALAIDAGLLSGPKYIDFAVRLPDVLDKTPQGFWAVFTGWLRGEGVDHTGESYPLARFGDDCLLVAEAIGREADRIEASAGEPPKDRGGKHPWGDDDPETPLPPARLADRLGIPVGDTKRREALRKRLEMWRNANPSGDGWVEIEGARGRKPRYLYYLGRVWPLIEDMKPSG
jgi:hypothetical protein